MYTGVYKDTFGLKLFDCTEHSSKVSQLITLLKDSEVRSFLKTFIDCAIAESELQILKRLAYVEAILGVSDDSEVPTVPQKLTEIEAKVGMY